MTNEISVLCTAALAIIPGILIAYSEEIAWFIIRLINKTREGEREEEQNERKMDYDGK